MSYGFWMTPAQALANEALGGILPVVAAAENDPNVRPDAAYLAECLLAIEMRHREVEQDAIA